MLDLDDLKEILRVIIFWCCHLCNFLRHASVLSLFHCRRNSLHDALPTYAHLLLASNNLNTGLNGYTPTGISSWNNNKCRRPSHFIPLRSICPCEPPDCLNAISPFTKRILATASQVHCATRQIYCASPPAYFRSEDEYIPSSSKRQNPITIRDNCLPEINIKSHGYVHKRIWSPKF